MKIYFIEFWFCIVPLSPIGDKSPIVSMVAYHIFIIVGKLKFSYSLIFFIQILHISVTPVLDHILVGYLLGAKSHQTV